MILSESQGAKFRSTRDIDVNLLSTNNKEALGALLDEVGIHIVGGVMEVPPVEDFESSGSKLELNVDLLPFVLS